MIPRKTFILILLVSFSSLIMFGQFTKYGSAASVTYSDTTNDVLKTNKVLFNPTVYSQNVTAPYIDIKQVKFDNVTVGVVNTYYINLTLNTNIETADLTDKYLQYTIFGGKANYAFPDDLVDILCEIIIKFRYNEWSFTSEYGNYGDMSLTIDNDVISLKCVSYTGFYYWDLVAGKIVVYNQDSFTRSFVMSSEKLGTDLYYMDYLIVDDGFFLWNPTYDIHYFTPLDNLIDVMHTSKDDWNSIIIYENYLKTKPFLDIINAELQYVGTPSHITYKFILTLNSDITTLNMSNNLNNSISYIFKFYYVNQLALNLKLFWNTTHNCWNATYQGVSKTEFISSISFNGNDIILTSNTNWFLHYIEHITRFTAISVQEVQYNQLGSYYVDIFPNSLINDEPSEYNDVVLANDTSFTPLAYANVSDPVIDLQGYKFQPNVNEYFDILTIYVGGGLTQLTNNDRIDFYIQFTHYEYGVYGYNHLEINLTYSNGQWTGLYEQYDDNNWLNLSVDYILNIVNDYKFTLNSSGIFHRVDDESDDAILKNIIAYRTINSTHYNLDIYPNSFFEPIWYEPIPIEPEEKFNIFDYLWYILLSFAVVSSVGLLYYFQIFKKSCSREKNYFTPYCLNQREKYKQQLVQKPEKQPFFSVLKDRFTSFFQ